MDLSYLRKLIKILERSSLNELDIEEEGIKIKLVKSLNNQPTYHSLPSPTVGTAQEDKSPPSSDTQEITEEKEVPGVTYHEVKSPIVGTFYRAPAPDAASYVEVGDMVDKSTVLCIVEAMKLMNEIESDVKGKILKILVENGQPVEYNQTLFLIEPTE